MCGGVGGGGHICGWMETVATVCQSALMEIYINTLQPRQNSHIFPDDISKRIFLNENLLIVIPISLKFVRRVPVNGKPALVQIVASRRTGDKPSSKPMMVYLIDAYMRRSASTRPSLPILFPEDKDLFFLSTVNFMFVDDLPMYEPRKSAVMILTELYHRDEDFVPYDRLTQFPFSPEVYVSLISNIIAANWYNSRVFPI